MFENIRHDYFRRKAKKGSVVQIIFHAFRDAGFRAVLFYRIGRWFNDRRFRLGGVFFERLMHHLCHCWISTLARIGPGFVITHVCGIVIPPNVVLGKNCDIRQNVTFGGNYGKRNEDGQTNPRLGDNVSVGAGAVVLGPVQIGSNSIIGANAVVTNSIPENSVTAPFRAEILGTCKKNTESEIYNPSSTIIEHPEKKTFLSRREIHERLEELSKKIEKLEEKIKQQNDNKNCKHDH